MIDIYFNENYVTLYKLSPHHFQEIKKIIRYLEKIEHNLIRMFTDNSFNEIYFTFKKNENIIYVNVEMIKVNNDFPYLSKEEGDIKIVGTDDSKTQYFIVYSSKKEKFHVNFYDNYNNLILDLILEK